MPSPFDALDQMITDAVEASFGEEAAIVPRRSSQYAQRSSDTARQSMRVCGVFSAGPSGQPIKGRAVGGEFSGPTRLQSSTAEFWIGAAQFCALGYEIVAGDLVRFPCRPGEPAYAVSAVQHTDLGDVSLILVREDQPS